MRRWSFCSNKKLPVTYDGVDPREVKPSAVDPALLGAAKPRQEPHRVVTIDVAHVGRGEAEPERGQLLRYLGAGAAGWEIGAEHDVVAVHQLQQRGDRPHVRRTGRVII